MIPLDEPEARIPPPRYVTLKLTPLDESGRPLYDQTEEHMVREVHISKDDEWVTVEAFGYTL